MYLIQNLMPTFKSGTPAENHSLPHLVKNIHLKYRYHISLLSMKLTQRAFEHGGSQLLLLVVLVFLPSLLLKLLLGVAHTILYSVHKGAV